jgi:hypothetical protein
MKVEFHLEIQGGAVCEINRDCTEILVIGELKRRMLFPATSLNSTMR